MLKSLFLFVPSPLPTHDPFISKFIQPMIRVLALLPSYCPITWPAIWPNLHTLVGGKDRSSATAMCGKGSDPNSSLRVTMSDHNGTEMWGNRKSFSDFWQWSKVEKTQGPVSPETRDCDPPVIRRELLNCWIPSPWIPWRNRFKITTLWWTNIAMENGHL